LLLHNKFPHENKCSKIGNINLIKHNRRKIFHDDYHKLTTSAQLLVKSGDVHMMLYNSPMKLIIFDFDGVLVDTQKTVNKLVWKYLSELGMKMTLAEFVERFSGETAHSIVERLKEEDNLIFSKDSQHFAKEIDEIVLSRISKQKIKPLKGVKKALQALPLKTCIASNCSLKILDTWLLMSTLASYFKDNVFSAEMVEKPKPDPALLLYAAQSMGIAPEYCLVVEDSVVGIKAAIAAGMKAWGFVGGNYITNVAEEQLLQAGAEHVFTKMEKLIKILKEDSANFS
jgi:HAD superfamily hydrolase (TIGR01509 family)